MSRARSGAIAGVLALVVGIAGGAAAGADGPVWGKNWAAGQTLPLPFGVGLTVYEQHQDYAITSLFVGVPGFESLPTDRLDIDNRIREVNFKVDAWLLPFLNVFLMGGQLDGRTVVDFSGVQLPFPIPLGDVIVNYDGEVYGGGATLAAGTERLFGSLTAVFTETDLSGDFDSDAQAYVISPRFGLHDDRGSIWLGAMYQQAEESHAGTISLPFVGPVPFAVELAEKDAWNGLAGAAVRLGGPWHLELEGGFGNRECLAATVAYRF